MAFSFLSIEGLSVFTALRLSESWRNPWDNAFYLITLSSFEILDIDFFARNSYQKQ